MANGRLHTWSDLATEVVLAKLPFALGGCRSDDTHLLVEWLEVLCGGCSSLGVRPHEAWMSLRSQLRRWDSNGLADFGAWMRGQQLLRVTPHAYIPRGVHESIIDAACLS